MATEVEDLKVREKQEVKPSSEQMTPGPIFSPAVDIFEDDNALTLVADVPGVPPENIHVDLRDDILTITGVPSVAMPEGETYLLREFEVGKYFRQFTLSEVVDQEKIEAKVSNGVLRLTLPKVAPAKPRRVQVTEG